LEGVLGSHGNQGLPIGTLVRRAGKRKAATTTNRGGQFWQSKQQPRLSKAAAREVSLAHHQRKAAQGDPGRPRLGLHRGSPSGRAAKATLRRSQGEWLQKRSRPGGTESASNGTEGWRYVTWLTDIDRWLCYRAVMSKLVTQAELLEIVPELRAMAAAEPADNVREALNRLVDRYAAMSRRSTLPPGPGAHQPDRGAASVY
jgi:hypothetical protein